MADSISQPLTVFSRDLRYMLDSRHAAAPLRRSPSKSVVVALLVVAAAVGVWTETRLLTTPVDQTNPTVSRAERQSPVAQHLATRQTKYTQLEQSISKTNETPHSWHAFPDRQGESRDAEPELVWKSYSVRRGDTLGKIFSRFSIDIGLASRIAEHETGQVLKKLMPEQKIYFGFDENKQLVKLRYELSRMEELVISFDSTKKFTVGRAKAPVKTREHSASQIIGSSLFLSASRAGLSDRLIMELVSIFGWEIDFALDIRSGDRFSIIYEEVYKNDELVGTGDIVAAEFVNNGSIFHAVRHIDDNGRKEYFDLEGNNLRGTFLKTPMRISRVTSGFSKRRFHPVLKKWRAHRGVDYGAPPGTPVLATGDGRVHSVGRNGGYGNTVVLQHGGQYSTLYAHLSGYKKGIRRGAVVRQGDVVGYVGSTGLATGPHLHYEFRVNGTHRDPLSFESPKAQPIADRYRDRFLAMARDRISEIAEIRPEQVASR